MKELRRFGWMQFSKILIPFILVLAFAFKANATDLMDTIESKQLGSCETNNLSFASMKFYKIPMEEKHEGMDVFLRVLFFFNQDHSLVTRFTTQALVGCQTTSSGEEACSYKPLKDNWFQSRFLLLSSDELEIPEIGKVKFYNPQNDNRGFQLQLSPTFSVIKLQNKSFIGGMVRVNFNQQGINTAKLCSP
jgi:hypothetical protein